MNATSMAAMMRIRQLKMFTPLLVRLLFFVLACTLVSAQQNSTSGSGIEPGDFDDDYVAADPIGPLANYTRALLEQNVGVFGQGIRIGNDHFASQSCHVVYLGNQDWATMNVSVRFKDGPGDSCPPGKLRRAQFAYVDGYNMPRALSGGVSSSGGAPWAAIVVEANGDMGAIDFIKDGQLVFKDDNSSPPPFALAPSTPPPESPQQLASNIASGPTRRLMATARETFRSAYENLRGNALAAAASAQGFGPGPKGPLSVPVAVAPRELASAGTSTQYEEGVLVKLRRAHPDRDPLWDVSFMYDEAQVYWAPEGDCLAAINSGIGLPAPQPSCFATQMVVYVYNPCVDAGTDNSTANSTSTETPPAESPPPASPSPSPSPIPDSGDLWGEPVRTTVVAGLESVLDDLAPYWAIDGGMGYAEVIVTYTPYDRCIRRELNTIADVAVQVMFIVGVSLACILFVVLLPSLWRVLVVFPFRAVVYAVSNLRAKKDFVAPMKPGLHSHKKRAHWRLSRPIQAVLHPVLWLRKHLLYAVASVHSANGQSRWLQVSVISNVALCIAFAVYTPGLAPPLERFIPPLALQIQRDSSALKALILFWQIALFSAFLGTLGFFSMLANYNSPRNKYYRVQCVVSGLAQLLLDLLALLQLISLLAQWNDVINRYPYLSLVVFQLFNLATANILQVLIISQWHPRARQELMYTVSFAGPATGKGVVVVADTSSPAESPTGSAYRRSSRGSDSARSKQGVLPAQTSEEDDMALAINRASLSPQPPQQQQPHRRSRRIAPGGRAHGHGEIDSEVVSDSGKDATTSGEVGGSALAAAPTPRRRLGVWEGGARPVAEGREEHGLSVTGPATTPRKVAGGRSMETDGGGEVHGVGSGAEEVEAEVVEYKNRLYEGLPPAEAKSLASPKSKPKVKKTASLAKRLNSNVYGSDDDWQSDKESSSDDEASNEKKASLHPRALVKRAYGAVKEDDGFRYPAWFLAALLVSGYMVIFHYGRALLWSVKIADCLQDPGTCATNTLGKYLSFVSPVLTSQQANSISDSLTTLLSTRDPLIEDVASQLGVNTTTGDISPLYQFNKTEVMVTATDLIATVNNGTSLESLVTAAVAQSLQQAGLGDAAVTAAIAASVAPSVYAAVQTTLNSTVSTLVDQANTALNGTTAKQDAAFNYVNTTIYSMYDAANVTTSLLTKGLNLKEEIIVWQASLNARLAWSSILGFTLGLLLGLSTLVQTAVSFRRLVRKIRRARFTRKFRRNLQRAGGNADVSTLAGAEVPTAEALVATRARATQVSLVVFFFGVLMSTAVIQLYLTGVILTVAMAFITHPWAWTFLLPKYWIYIAAVVGVVLVNKVVLISYVGGCFLSDGDHIHRPAAWLAYLFIMSITNLVIGLLLALYRIILLLLTTVVALGKLEVTIFTYFPILDLPHNSFLAGLHLHESMSMFHDPIYLPGGRGAAHRRWRALRTLVRKVSPEELQMLISRGYSKSASIKEDHVVLEVETPRAQMSESTPMPPSSPGAASGSKARRTRSRQAHPPPQGDGTISDSEI